MPALIFDCDGVLADTERFGHLPAFNQMFEELGVPVQWSDEDYADLLRIGGGKERMASILTPDFVANAGLPQSAADQAELVARWHRRKTEIYTDLVRSGAMPARPGVRRISAEAVGAGWTLAVASTSAEASVRSVLEHAVGAELARSFGVFAGDVVAAKKPAPDIYELAVDELGADKAQTVVVEDSRNGMLAALAADLRCLVTVSSYTRSEDFTGAALVVESLGDPGSSDRSAVLTEPLADPFDVDPTPYVDLQTLYALLERAPRPSHHHHHKDQVHEH
jgi:HAD superfamily hydrolase (TIGR01509 family)